MTGSAEIREEYEPLEPLLDAEIAEKTGKLAEAQQPVDDMQRQLGELEKQCAEVEAQCSGWQARTTDTSAELRVEGHILWREWVSELARLEEKRDRLERDMQPLEAHRDKCAADRDAAVLSKAVFVGGLAFPFTSEKGQATTAYVQYRLPFLHGAVLRGPDDPEFQMGIVQLREMAKVAGFDLIRTPDSVRAEKFWHASYDALGWNDPDPAPSGRQIIDDFHTQMGEMAEHKNARELVSEIVDNRQPRPPKRDYLEVPGTPGDYKKLPG